MIHEQHKSLVLTNNYNLVNIRHDTTEGVLLSEYYVTFVRGLTNSLKLKNWRQMTVRSKKSPIISSQENNSSH